MPRTSSTPNSRPSSRGHCDGDSSCYMGYSDTMQLMAKAGVNPVDGYHRGAPQIVHLDLECKGEPLVKVKHWKVPTKEVADYSGKRHLQFNAMCVCTLKVAKKDRHGLTTQP